MNDSIFYAAGVITMALLEPFFEPWLCRAAGECERSGGLEVKAFDGQMSPLADTADARRPDDLPYLWSICPQEAAFRLAEKADAPQGVRRVVAAVGRRGGAEVVFELVHSPTGLVTPAEVREVRAGQPIGRREGPAVVKRSAGEDLRSTPRATGCDTEDQAHVERVVAHLIGHDDLITGAKKREALSDPS